MATGAGVEPRSKRSGKASARVLDPVNVGKKQLSSHKAAQAEAIQKAREAEALR